MKQDKMNRAMNLFDSIRFQAEKSPSAEALLEPGHGTLTYAGLMDRIDLYRTQLIAKDVRPGDRVGIQLPHGIETICWLLAVMDFAVAAPLDPHLTPRERTFTISNLHLNWLIDSNGIHPNQRQRPASAAPDLAMLLQSSGTTARPKKVPLTHANLLKNLHNVLRILGLNATDRCFNMMPLFHLHGIFFGLLVPLASGGSVVCPAQSIPEFPWWMEKYLPTWYSASPTFHQAVLDHTNSSPSLMRQNRLRFIRSSAGPLSAALNRQLEEALETPVIQGYGMTECVHISCNPLPPGERRTGSVGIGTGPEIAILHEMELVTTAGQTGEIVIRGDEVIENYEGLEVQDSSFYKGWLRTGDLGYLDSESYLHLTGRVKEMINRGGQKISPLEVEEVLVEHPAVSKAASFPIPHPRLGEDGAVAIVLNEGYETTEKELRIFCGTRLSSYKVPGYMIFVEDLPKTATGKLIRRNLAQMFDPSIHRKASDNNNLGSNEERQVAAIWCEVLKMPHIERWDNFFHLGGDSILATYMISRVRKVFQVDLPLSRIFEMPTLEEFCSGMLEGPGASPGDAAPAQSLPEIKCDFIPLKDCITRNLNFSLFFFSADESQDSENKYRLLLNAARFADEHGFEAIWTPERHFHAFGGLYPNPSVIGAALAMTTKNLKIRAGSVVLPLQDPLRVAEEWSVVDNLSGGRVGIAAASGWQVNDFVFSPASYNDRKELMFKNLDLIRNLWRGNSTFMPNGLGQEVEVTIFPRPVQRELPVWLACHSDSTFIKAGELGCNIITTIYKSTPETLKRQIALYRETLERNGVDPEEKIVTLMLHTFVGAETRDLTDMAKVAFDSYFSSFLGLQKYHAGGLGREFELSKPEIDFIVSRALPEILKERALIGSIEFCHQRAIFFQSIGVNEVACLIDFGIDTDTVLQSLTELKLLKDRFQHH